LSNLLYVSLAAAKSFTAIPICSIFLINFWAKKTPH
jgi:hypothetical protein